jgi:hypothetical protein
MIFEKNKDLLKVFFFVILISKKITNLIAFENTHTQS